MKTIKIILVSLFLCFYSHEIISGFNKICFYDCLSGEKAITIKGYETCPLTINEGF